MIEELTALANGQRMGSVLWDRKRDKLSFVYEQSWRDDASTFPLSLSLPLASVQHEHTAVYAFLWGLLPDNDGVLQKWGKRFQVSPRNPFKLLLHVGEDCAGAVQLVKPECVDAWLQAARTREVKWMEDGEIAQRMRMLLTDHSASRTSADRGQFSLAGAQPKTAFHFDPKKNRWGVPAGRVPTTHIFKPATGAYDGYAENEHFCMTLARELGMAVATSEVRYFEDTPVIVVERYDRRWVGSKVSRIHQEDMCQTLSRLPQQKYQNQGGPSAREIMDLIRRHSTGRESDVMRFLDALMLNWFMAGTDAHAKNYSFLIGAKGSVRLAPLYDLSSALPYPQQVLPRHATLAMKIGGKYKLREIGVREWKRAATELDMDEGVVRDRLLWMAQQLPHAALKVKNGLVALGIRHGVMMRLVKALTDRAMECRSMKF